jgi:hypothetical protein
MGTLVIFAKKNLLGNDPPLFFFFFGGTSIWFKKIWIDSIVIVLERKEKDLMYGVNEIFPHASRGTSQFLSNLQTDKKINEQT